MPGIGFTLVPPHKNCSKRTCSKRVHWSQTAWPRRNGPWNDVRYMVIVEIHPSLHSLWKGLFARKWPSYFPLNPGCWIGILKMAHYNPHITGQYIPLYTLTDQGPFFSLLKCLTGLPGESHYDHPWYWKMQQHRSRKGSILAIKKTQLGLGETMNHNKDLCFC